MAAGFNAHGKNDEQWKGQRDNEQPVLKNGTIVKFDSDSGDPWKGKETMKYYVTAA